MSGMEPLGLGYRAPINGTQTGNRNEQDSCRRGLAVIRKEGWMCEKKRSGASPRGYLRPRTGHLRMGVRLPPPPPPGGVGRDGAGRRGNLHTPPTAAVLVSFLIKADTPRSLTSRGCPGWTLQ